MPFTPRDDSGSFGAGFWPAGTGREIPPIWNRVLL
jgi:hypothetical protein